MKKLNIILLQIASVLSCTNEVESDKIKFLVNELPKNEPIEFIQDLIPSDKIVHKGIFSPKIEEYYYTVSDKNFKQFDVYVIKKENGFWSKPKLSFFNSEYSEHGMSFSPDGQTIYFSSTRPVNIDGVARTWHIWKSEKVSGKWDDPKYVDIPNLRNKLVSHPTITDSGRMYFHSSNLDYGEMDIYCSREVNGNWEIAQKVEFSVNLKTGTCTPYVSSKEDYLLFASIGDQLDLMVSYNDGNGGWKNTRKLNDDINNYGQGNPFVTPDDKYLFFTTGIPFENNWSIKWIDIASELKNN